MSRSALTSALDELGRRLEDGDLELGVFDDAEIAAVTPSTLRESRLVPLTALDALEVDEQERAIAAARESLAERGCLTGGDPVEAVDELAAVLEFRENPSAIVIADHLSRDGDDFSLYLYGIGNAGYLVESTRENEHAFAAQSTRVIVERLAELVDPRGNAGAVDGPQLERRAEEAAPPGWDEFESDVKRTHTIVRFSSSRKTAPDTVEDSIVSFAASEGGVWGYSGYAGDSGLVVAARCLSRRSVEDGLAAFLGVGQVAVRLD